MAKSDKDAAWEQYKKYIYERDIRKRSDESAEIPEGPSCDTDEANDRVETKPETPPEKEKEPVSETDEGDLYVEDSPEVSSEDSSDETETLSKEADSPDTSVEKQGFFDKIGAFIKKHRKIFGSIFVILLAAADTADMYALAVLARSYMPWHGDKIFELTGLNTIDRSVWNPDTFVKVLYGLVSFLLMGFAAFLVQVIISKLMKAANVRIFSAIVTILLPVAFCGLTLWYLIKTGFAVNSICIFSAMCGGLFFLILNKIKFEVPVDSVKTEKKSKKQ